jgi:single-strand DNA-binding protein
MINKFIGIGNLTKDPESKTLGEYVKCSFPIAINSTKDEVIFLDVESWGKTAENCKKYITKGSQVYVEGKIKINKWEDKSGNRRQKYYISSDLVRFLPREKKPAPQEVVPQPSSSVKEIIEEEDMPF